MTEPKRVLTEEEVSAIANEYDPCFDDVTGGLKKHEEIVKSAEPVIIAKRDAEWREAAREACLREGRQTQKTCLDWQQQLAPGDLQCLLCHACCTVARMEKP